MVGCANHGIMTKFWRNALLSHRGLFAVVLSISCGFWFVPSARAQMTIEHYEILANTEGKTREEIAGVLTFYLNGLITGISWMMAEYRTGPKAAPLLCWRPNDLPGVMGYMDWIDRELRERPELRREKSDLPVARVMMDALRREFPLPCK